MNLFKKLSTLAVSAFLLLGVGLTIGQQNVKEIKGDSVSYSLAFKDSGNSSDGNVALTTSTTVASVFNTNSSKISAISSTSKVYFAKAAYGLKFGSSSAVGTLSFSLSEAITVTKISAKLLASDANAPLTINGIAGVAGASLSFVDFTFSSETEISSISIAGTKSSKGRFYITQLDLYTTGGGSEVVLTSLLAPSLSDTTIDIGSTITASTTYAPTDTTESITWSITGTNTDAATISNIVMADGEASITVTGAKAGSCTITATPTVTTGLAKTSSALTVTAPTLTGLEMNKATADLNKNETLQLSVTPTPSAADASVTWTSSNPDVATVGTNGLVTATSTTGNTTITATSTSVPTISATCVVTVVDEITYQLVSSLAELAIGDKIVFGGVNDSTYYSMKEYDGSSNNVKATTATLSGNILTPAADVGVFTLGKEVVDSTTYYTFKDSTGYLYATSSGSNNMKTESTVSDNSRWTVTLTSGVFKIQATLSSYRNLMRFNYNNGTPIFSCYASSSTTGVAPTLYYKTSASLLANYVMAEETSGQCTTKFDIAKSKYLVLPSNEQTLFKTAQEGEDTVLTNARARYLAWATNQGQKPWETGAALGNLETNSDSNIQIISIAVIGVISLASVGAFFFHSKKRIINK